MKVREAMAKTADFKQVDLKQVRDEVADRVGRAAKELTSGAGNAARELTATAEESLSSQIRKQTKAARKRMPAQRGRSRWPMITGAIAGALTVYFFDPERGRARRAQFIDWSGARLRRGQRAAARLLSRTGDSAASLPARMVRLQSGPRPADDLTLRDRVESEVFRSPDVPKGQINIDVESGVVTVRGQVDSALQIARIEKDVLKVPGVRGVENLLHVDGTPAPNKAEARETS
ncbi:MAG TPA: BON domain-containing protein [Candidatus Dormibacteraeota bacterium]|jgi:osmotically-inducible protein OsmY|nr:BON domain-containing protein [Candidatus Dormibacteraeota bacterium]